MKKRAKKKERKIPYGKDVSHVINDYLIRDDRVPHKDRVMAREWGGDGVSAQQWSLGAQPYLPLFRIWLATSAHRVSVARRARPQSGKE